MQKQSWANTIGAAGLLHAGLSGNRNSRYKGEIPSAGRWIRRGYTQARREMYRNGTVIYNGFSLRW